MALRARVRITGRRVSRNTEQYEARSRGVENALERAQDDAQCRAADRAVRYLGLAEDGDRPVVGGEDRALETERVAHDGDQGDARHERGEQSVLDEILSVLLAGETDQLL